MKKISDRIWWARFLGLSAALVIALLVWFHVQISIEYGYFSQRSSYTPETAAHIVLLERSRIAIATVTVVIMLLLGRTYLQGLSSPKRNPRVRRGKSRAKREKREDA
jgi:hypothetical protein